MPLIGALPQPITSAPLVILLYVVLTLMIVSALTSVLVRDTLWAIGAFSSSMVLIAVLYLTIAPFLLFAVQLPGLGRSTQGPLHRDWIVGAAVVAALLALLVVVLATTSWPIGLIGNAGPGVGEALGTKYVVGLAVLVVILASAALGSGLMLAAPTLPSLRGGGPIRGSGPRR